MNVQTPSSECPVAVLAREAKALIEARNRLEELILEASGARRIALQHRLDVLEARISAAGNSASHIRARGAIGMMFQLHHIASLVDVMANPAGNEDQQEQSRFVAEAAIKRMLYSVRDEIERMTGERAEDACSSYYMNREYNPLDMVEKALTVKEVEQ